jgi:hypothetical protein
MKSRNEKGVLSPFFMPELLGVVSCLLMLGLVGPIMSSRMTVSGDETIED